MAKIQIMANAFALVSTIKTESIKALTKFHPDQLVQRNPETKDAIFAIAAVSEGKGTVNAYGVSFDGTNTDGYAQVTKLFPEGTKAEDREKYITNNIGGALLTLNNFEAEVAAKTAALDDEMATVKANITVVG